MYVIDGWIMFEKEASSVIYKCRPLRQPCCLMFPTFFASLLVCINDSLSNRLFIDIFLFCFICSLHILHIPIKRSIIIMKSQTVTGSSVTNRRFSPDIGLHYLPCWWCGVVLLFFGFFGIMDMRNFTMSQVYPFIHLPKSHFSPSWCHY